MFLKYHSISQPFHKLQVRLIPSKRKLEANFQISQHELTPAFIDPCTFQVSESNATMPLYMVSIYSGTQRVGVCIREASCGTCDKKI